MADVQIRVVATINASFGVVKVDLNHHHKDSGRPLSDEVALAVFGAVQQLRELVPMGEAPDGGEPR